MVHEPGTCSSGAASRWNSFRGWNSFRESTPSRCVSIYSSNPKISAQPYNLKLNSSSGLAFAVRFGGSGKIDRPEPLSPDPKKPKPRKSETLNPKPQAFLVFKGGDSCGGGRLHLFGLDPDLPTAWGLAFRV